MITVKINQKEIRVQEGTTIRTACEWLDIDLPTLCYDPELSLSASCRLCIVEIKNRRGFFPACITPCEDGMEVETETEHLIRNRKVLLELLLANQPEHKLNPNGNRFAELCERYHVTESRFTQEGETYHRSIDDPNPFILRNYDQCVMCTRCVRICNEIVGAKAIQVAGRGHDVRIAVSMDSFLKKSTCIYCGQCVMVCPSGALVPKNSTLTPEDGPVTEVASTCAFCSIGCNFQLSVQKGRVRAVTSSRDPDISLNRGFLCSKGRFGWDYIYGDDRLQTPYIRRNGELEPCSWETALDYTADRQLEIKEKYGPQSLAMFCSSRLTNEENYLSQKLMRAGIGSNNINQCSKVNDLDAMCVLRDSLGISGSPNTIRELENEPEVIFLFGTNYMSRNPVAHFKLMQNVRYKGAKLIIANPKLLNISDQAVLNLQYKPGTEIDLLNGIMHVICIEDMYNREFIEKNHAEGFGELAVALMHYTPDKVSETTGVPAEEIRQAARLYARSKKSMICIGVSVVEKADGVNHMRLLCDMAVLTGNLGRPGSGILFVRDQNNVQGSCDMGCTHPFLSGYQRIKDPAVREKFARFWGVEKLADYAGQNVGKTIAKIGSGDIKGLYVLGADPVKRNPGIMNTKKNLEQLDFMVVQELTMTATAKMADVVFPGASYAESDGTYTSTDRKVQRVRKAVEPLAGCKNNWQILCELSGRLGYPMHYENSEQIFDEIRTVIPEYAGITYARLEKERAVFWPCPDENHPGSPVLYTDGFAQHPPRFYTILEPRDSK